MTGHIRRITTIISLLLASVLPALPSGASSLLSREQFALGPGLFKSIPFDVEDSGGRVN